MRAAFAVMSAALLGGCAADDSDPCAYKACAIEDSACVERVARAVACQRDTELVLPEVRYMTVDEVVAEINETSEPPHADSADFIRGEALMGLMPEGYAPAEATADTYSRVAAFYRRTTKEITIITDNTGSDLETGYAILVHEIVHAVQDADFDLDAGSERHAYTFDRNLAYRAVIEGDAVLHEAEAAAALDGYSPEDLDWGGWFDDWQVDVRKRADETDSPSQDASLLFPYAFGGEYVFDNLSDRAPARVGHMFDKPPTSVRHVVDGLPGGDAGNGDAELAPVAVPMLGGYRPLGMYNASVWLVYAMLVRLADARLWDPELHLLRADALTVLKDEETGEVIAVWRLLDAGNWTLGGRWAEPAPSPYRSAVVDGDLVLVATTSTDADAVIARIDGWQSHEAAFGRSGSVPPRRSALPTWLP